MVKLKTMLVDQAPVVAIESILAKIFNESISH